MAKFKNVSPLGALDIPALGQIVEAGEVFEVADDMTSYFADQTANFEPVVDRPTRRRSTRDVSRSDPQATPGERDASVVTPGEIDSSPEPGDTDEKEGDR